jgi:multiple sugar transport system ATP-binding protein
MVFQNYALYPHKNVRENIGFPLRMQHKSKAEIERSVRDVAVLLGIESLLDRKPRELSGGQRQRVAMGRAIVRHPQVFLMDEPLSNLDAKLRIQMRVELVKLHRRLGVTTIYVTHDQTEAMTLGQRVAVLNQGRVQQVAPPRQLYLDPVNSFVASFIGSPPMNFIRGRLRPGGIELGPVGIDLPPEVMGRVTPGKGELLVGLRPECLQLLPPGAPAALMAEIEVIEQLGAESYIYVRIPGTETVAFGDRPVELAARFAPGSTGSSISSRASASRLASDPNSCACSMRRPASGGWRRDRSFGYRSGDALLTGGSMTEEGRPAPVVPKRSWRLASSLLSFGASRSECMRE